MWAFKALWDKGLLYEGERVLPYCWVCETPLSNFETRQDDAYRPRQDPAVTVLFTLEADDSGRSPAALSGPLRVMAWTTTPWTLPSNLALAVGPDIEYAVYELLGRHDGDRGGACRRLSRSPRGRRAPGGIQGVGARGAALPTAVPVLLGPTRRLPGARRRLRRHRRGHRGRAPRAGLRRGGLRRVQGGGHRRGVPGRRPRPFHRRGPSLRGAAGVRRQPPHHRRPEGRRRPRRGQELHPQLPALLADRHAAHLQGRGLVVRGGHRRQGPHDRAQPGDRLGPRPHQGRRLREVARRSARTGRSAGTGSGARPSRCGRATTPATPAPTSTAAWRSSRPTSGCGSPTCTARPSTSSCGPNPDDPTGRSTMRRVTDVLDCWFESGSMPFAQVHYPFERAEWFESHFPADFIVEYVAQTRGWFYTLHVLATALFDRPPFRHCVAHGDRARRRRAEDVQAPRQLPRARHGLRHVGRGRHALVPPVVTDPAGPGPRRPRQRRSRRCGARS